MRIAVTGGTGFVGRHLARALAAEGHETVLVARGRNLADPTLGRLPNARFHAAGLEDAEALTNAFAGCEAVAHCAGINRETGQETFQKVHVDGTRRVVDAARRVRAKKLVLISFLRARPDCSSGYHESKWQAEEIVRHSDLDYTVLKCGVIYGRGDHMLDHLSHAFYTFPVFAFVGYRDKPVRPNAVEDVVAIVKAALTQGALSRKTAAVIGPEQLTLREAVRRVARVAGRRPLMFPLPLWFHYALGWCAERIMTVPLVSVAQVRMLSEGLAEPNPPCEAVPEAWAPRLPFSEEQIRQGLPAPGPFGLRDLRCCRQHRRGTGRRRVFFEMP
jgi:uncharacterized protein YbjT (DUF2867 family)